MLLFRSEEHANTWTELRGTPRGAFITLEQQWRLASAWYANHLDPDYRRRTPEEKQAVFASLGLTDGFWRLRP